MFLKLPERVMAVCPYELFINLFSLIFLLNFKEVYEFLGPLFFHFAGVLLPKMNVLLFTFSYM